MPKKNNKIKIYLDHAATTPLDPRVLKKMMPYMEGQYGNASSSHSYGQEAMAGVNSARKILADYLNCSIEEVIFTSGATESNNLAIQGFVKYHRSHPLISFSKGREKLNIPHIITSQIEHPAVLEVCQSLEKEGVEVTYVNVGKDGLVNTLDVQKAIKPNTILVSIMYVNNEIGTIQPIREIGKMIEKYNLARQKEAYILADKEKTKMAEYHHLIFHTDATQAINYCNCNVKYLHVDMLSLSGHKIYGPKGIGALYVKKNVGLAPVYYGGHHEKGLRSGTYNTPGIVGLGKAIEILQKENHKRIEKLRDKIIRRVMKELPDVCINGSMSERIPSNINFSFQGLEGESLMIMLDMEGIAVSTGSACSSSSCGPSYVLTAIGVPHLLGEGSIRITLGKNNSSNDIDYFIQKLIEKVQKLRKISGNE